MPALETVAGEAVAKSCASKSNETWSDITIRSLFTNVSTLKTRRFSSYFYFSGNAPVSLMQFHRQGKVRRSKRWTKYTLLSSMTLFMFSIQSTSTGPSKRIHFSSAVSSVKRALSFIIEYFPGINRISEREKGFSSNDLALPSFQCTYLLLIKSRVIFLYHLIGTYCDTTLILHIILLIYIHIYIMFITSIPSKIYKFAYS